MKSKVRHHWVMKEKFACIHGNDHRAKEYAAFKKRHGFSPDETWSLDAMIMEFSIPRLEELRKRTIAVPYGVAGMEEWQGILSNIIEGFELYLDECNDAASQKRIREAADLFHRYFFNLGW